MVGERLVSGWFVWWWWSKIGRLLVRGLCGESVWLCRGGGGSGMKVAASPTQTPFLD